MKQSNNSTFRSHQLSSAALLLLATTATTVDAFSVAPSVRNLSTARSSGRIATMPAFTTNHVPPMTSLYMSAIENDNDDGSSSTVSTTETSSSSSPPVSSEVEKLRSMAAKLRAEAASLEANKAAEQAEATERAFRKFDTNQDGEVTLQELKDGLEKLLKTELQQERVEKLMKAFDSSGDGALQLDEFVGVDRFRSQLDAIVREEKAAAKAAQDEAKREAELAQLAEARMELLNDKPPTNTEKVLSVLPYIFPLMDGLQFGRFLLQGEDQNPIVTVLALVYVLYRSIPFSGFIAFFSLNFLSNSLGINRLIRYNMQQAIFLDIALFFPGLIAGVAALIAQGVGVQPPAILAQIGTDAVFVGLVVAISYSVVSSLLGEAPDKIPGISDQVLARMPTIDMFDDEGRFVPRNVREEQEKQKKDTEGSDDDKQE